MEKIYAAFTLMSCAIHLNGKFQIVERVDEDGNPIILQVNGLLTDIETGRENDGEERGSPKERQDRPCRRR